MQKDEQKGINEWTSFDKIVEVLFFLAGVILLFLMIAGQPSQSIPFTVHLSLNLSDLGDIQMLIPALGFQVVFYGSSLRFQVYGKVGAIPDFEQGEYVSLNGQS